MMSGFLKLCIFYVNLYVCVLTNGLILKVSIICALKEISNKILYMLRKYQEYIMITLWLYLYQKQLTFLD